MADGVLLSLDAWLTSVQASAPPSWSEKGAGYRWLRPRVAVGSKLLPWGGSFRLESMAALPWNDWQLSCGISGKLRLESVAAFVWNAWQVCPGISGRFGVEYAAKFALRTPLGPREEVR